MYIAVAHLFNYFNHGTCYPSGRSLASTILLIPVDVKILGLLSRVRTSIYVRGCVWCVSLRIMSLRSAHVVACVRWLTTHHTQPRLRG